jgi:hypothetical protein
MNMLMTGPGLPPVRVEGVGDMQYDSLKRIFEADGYTIEKNYLGEHEDHRDGRVRRGRRKSG